MELNREQTKKALEWCYAEETCSECPYQKICFEASQWQILGDALALINSQEHRIKELTEENEGLRVDKKKLINENEELKKQIQEADFTEEEIDFIDEYTRLLNEGIRDAKANNVSEIKTRFAMRFGTYTDKDMTPITEVFRLLDQIAKEMLDDNT